MKVLAKIDHKKFICEINMDELEKFMDLYYGKMKELKVGDEMNLGEGYNWFQKTNDALKSTQIFFKDNIANINAITSAFTMGIINEDKNK